MSRRTLRVLGLMLITALLGASFVGVADAKRTRHHSRAHKLSKAQKKAISKQLMRAVKKNPRVIGKRWFLKKASLVSFSLPSTIRLDQAGGQNGQSDPDNPAPRSRALLDLGPSLGTRSIPLSGVLHANINFNDAFDGGHLGDVRITLPPDPAATLKTTSVPLLTNPNVTNPATKASQNEINRVVAIPAVTGGAGTTIQFRVDPGAPDGGIGTQTVTIPDSPEIDACVAGFPAPNLAACTAAGKQIDAVLEALTGVGPGNMYTIAANGSIATGGAAPSSSLLIQFVGVGGLNQTKIGGIDTVGGTPIGTFLGVGTLTATVVQAQKATYDAQDMGGCGNWSGNGFAQLPPGGANFDVDALNRLLGKNGASAPSPAVPDAVSTGANTTGNDEAMGDGYVSPDPTATPGDVVLRTGALSLGIAVPTTSAQIPGDNTDNPGSTVAAGGYTGPGTTVNVSDAAPFTAGDKITLTDGFQSNTGTVTASDASTNPNTITVTWDAPAPTASTTYAAESAIFVNSNGVVTKSIGTSGGRANLFGQPINGLAKGNSVDVTVNLGTDISSIAREVDGNRPKPIGGNAVTTNVGAAYTAGSTTLVLANRTGLNVGDSIAVGTSAGGPTDRGVITVTGAGAGPVTLAGTGLAHNHALGDFVSHTPEVGGNISAYFNCRQAWTGSVRNYLTGIKLVGALRVSPAVTADGKVRIAKVNLRTPAPVPESLAACLSPYQLYMKGNPLAADFAFGAPLDVAPGLLFGAEFNPLLVLSGSSRGVATKPSAVCNAGGGPLDREPFNTGPQPGGTGLSNILNTGAAVGVSGTLTTTIKADVVIGTFNN